MKIKNDDFAEAPRPPSLIIGLRKYITDYNQLFPFSPFVAKLGVNDYSKDPYLGSSEGAIFFVQKVIYNL